MKILKGDIFKFIESGKVDVVVHGCNCFCQMGAGIAQDLKNKYPNVYLADLKTLKGDKRKLGTYSHAEIIINNKKITIINAYTQYKWTGKKLLLNYKALAKVFKKIKVNFSGKTICYPMIGAGLAGGNWMKIQRIIDKELVGENHFCIILDKKKSLYK